jgi:cytosine deaminase
MPGLMRTLHTLRGARLADGAVVDIRLEGGTVGSIAPSTAVDSAGIEPADDELDLRGFLVMTAPAEPHAHLDKARSWDAANPPFGDLVRAVDSWRAFAASETEDDIYRRALAQATASLQLGTTAIRSHVDLFGDGDPLRGVRALLRVRERLAGLLELQLVALGGEWTPDEVFEAALDVGVDIMGGAPHLAGDPLAELRRNVAIADRLAVPIDLHTDESLDGPLTLGEYAKLVRGRPQPSAAGHCVRLGTLAPEQLAEIIAELSASDVGIISLPITNLYLQGWDHAASTPRGLTALRALLDAGVRVAAGADNVRDPFNPVGRGDALETASLLVSAGHLDLEESLRAVSDGARSVMSLPVAGPTVGAKAELLAVRAESIGDAIATASLDRVVIHEGRLVARSRVVNEVALPVEVGA